MDSKRANKINIAIDGPAGAGKSTVARWVAERLGYIYIDTGAMYRAVTWKSLERGLRPDAISDIVDIARQTTIELIPSSVGQKVLVDGLDVSEAIRSQTVTHSVSQVSSIAQVREILVRKQQDMAANKGIVMDGRDIGTKVIPDAEVKVFLTASVRRRAERRLLELKSKQVSITLPELEQEIEQRDRMDAGRAVSPLMKASDAVLLDSTEMDIPQVVESILALCREHMLDGETSR